jgi:hypothetical protein
VGAWWEIPGAIGAVLISPLNVVVSMQNYYQAQNAYARATQRFLTQTIKLSRVQ